MFKRFLGKVLAMLLSVEPKVTAQGFLLLVTGAFCVSLFLFVDGEIKKDQEKERAEVAAIQFFLDEGFIQLNYGNTRTLYFMNEEYGEITQHTDGLYFNYTGSSSTTALEEGDTKIWPYNFNVKKAYGYAFVKVTLEFTQASNGPLCSKSTIDGLTRKDLEAVFSGVAFTVKETAGQYVALSDGTVTHCFPSSPIRVFWTFKEIDHGLSKKIQPSISEIEKIYSGTKGYLRFPPNSLQIDFVIPEVVAENDGPVNEAWVGWYGDYAELMVVHALDFPNGVESVSPYEKCVFMAQHANVVPVPSTVFDLCNPETW